MKRFERTLRTRESGSHETLVWADPVITSTDQNLGLELVAQRFKDQGRLIDLAKLSDHPAHFAFELASAAGYFAGKRQMVEQGIKGRAVVVDPVKAWLPEGLGAEQSLQFDGYTNVVVEPRDLQTRLNDIVGTPKATAVYFGFNRYGFMCEDGGSEPVFLAQRFGTLEVFGENVTVVDASFGGHKSIFVAAEGLEMTPLSTIAVTGLPAVRFGA